jgi:hypothetical protein
MTKPLLYETLKILFKDPIVILMIGDWRTGKTDTSLLIGYLAKKWGLIDKIGSNIWTFNNPEVEYIVTLGKLKKWLHADKSTKLFIFDEGLAHIPRRTAMSHKNVGVLKMLAELSKGHGRMIICSQIAKLDSDVLNPAFTRAVFIKRSKKVMECRSRYFSPRTFINLPKSPIKFDPDRLAPFIDTKMSKKSEKMNRGRVYEIAKLRVAGWTLSQIGDKFGLHVEQVRREIKKALKGFIDYVEAREDENDEKTGNQEIMPLMGNP